MLLQQESWAEFDSEVFMHTVVPESNNRLNTPLSLSASRVPKRASRALLRRRHPS